MYNGFKDDNEQIQRMQELMSFGINENTSKSNNTGIVEYHQVGPDGKTYGIIKECTKYYIKVAPKKDTEVLAEDYDYIGGINNKKANEYSSYSVASKQFDLKMRSLNEANNPNKGMISEQFKPQAESDWQTDMTREMRESINRFNEISYNMGYALAEDKKVFTMNHTLPEAPATDNGKPEKANGNPYTGVATPQDDKEFKSNATDPKKQGAPFDNEEKVTDSDMESTKNLKSSSKDGMVYTEKAKYAPEDTVTTKKPSGNKIPKINEGRVIKLTEAQVLAWNKSKDYMDKSHGTEIGDSAPYTKKPGNTDDELEFEIDINEDAMYHDDNLNNPVVGTGDAEEYMEPYEDEVDESAMYHDDNLNNPSVGTGNAQRKENLRPFRKKSTK